MIYAIIIGLSVIGLLFFVYLFSFNAFPALVSMVADTFKEILHINQPRVFDRYGVYLFCGRVGCGKTISMVNEARRLKRRFPKVKIYANFHCKLADGMISDWKDLLNIENIDENGVNQGVLFLFDEIHLTFDSQSWKSAPANLLEYISLQRHFHKCIFGSSQVWSRVNKILREQTDFVVECSNYFGKRLIKNVLFTQENYQINGDLKDAGMRKRKNYNKYFFYASNELRSLYDTDEIVGSLFESGKLGITKTEKKLLELDLDEKSS